MSNINYYYINNFIEDLLPPSKGLLKDLECYAHSNNIPIITPDVSSLLNIIIKSTNSKKILEIGTAIGYSSILMAKSSGDDCQIITIEKDPALAKISASNIEKTKYKDNIQVMTGDALNILKDINGEFDMIFFDAAKGQYANYFKYSIDKLKVGGLLICDNVLFKGMVANDDLLIRRKITIVKRLRAFLNNISNNKSLYTSIIPIGDGLSISLKIEEVIINE